MLAACGTDGQVQKEKDPVPANKTGAVEEKDDSEKHYVTIGYIVRKDEQRIVVRSVPEPSITKEELEAILKEKDVSQGIRFHFSEMEAVDEKTISSLRVGQKVVIEHDWYGLSAPAYGGHAFTIKVIEE